MLNELPKYQYVAENYAVVTWQGERVFDLLQGKALWLIEQDDQPIVAFSSFQEAERYVMSLVGDAKLVVKWMAAWYVIADAYFETFGSEDAAKNYIERVLRVREIIRGRLKNRT